MYLWQGHNAVPWSIEAEDYFYNKPDPIEDDNFGWPEPLEFDEYPLEIQCSSCFLFVPLLLLLPRSETRRGKISDTSH
jgi:hypothetical protein